MHHVVVLSRPFHDRLLRRVSDHLSLLRPSHWSKSLIAVPVGPLLVLDESTFAGLAALLGTIAAFMLASSAVYVINDLADIERDRLHPTKRLRPLPSGAVSSVAATSTLAALLLAVIASSFQLPLPVVMLVLAYLICNLGYSLFLKHVPIVEMLIVATGFALRAASGYLAFGLMPEERVIATVFAGSLLLTIGKRREELRRVENSTSHRPVLAHYTKNLLDAYLIVAAIACFGAALATLQHVFDTRGLPVLLFVSLPFATYLFLHYLMLVFARSGTGNPTRMLLTDRTIHGALIVWVLTIGTGVLLSTTPGQAPSAPLAGSVSG